MIYKTFGAGGDYATVKDCLDALEAAEPLFDDYTFTQISDVTETATQFGDWIDMIGHTVEFTTDTPHNGNPNVGWKIDVNGHELQFLSTSAATWKLSGLHFVQDRTSRNNAVTMSQSGVPPCSTIFLVNQCIFSTDVSVGAPTTNANAIQFNAFAYPPAAGATVRMKACKIYGFDTAFSRMDDIQFRGYVEYTVENCTVYWCRYGISGPGGGFKGYAGTPTTFRNVTVIESAALSSTKDWKLGNEIGLTIENCGDSDGSLVGVGVASDCQSNLVAANEFLSVDDTNEDFLIPPKDSVLSTGGHETEVTDKDIAEIDIPSYVEHEGQRLTPLVYPIGCHVGKYRPGHYRVDLNNNISAEPERGQLPLKTQFNYSEQYVVTEF